MGVRSNVALAVKRNPWTSLTVEERAKIQGLMGQTEQTLENPQGFLFVWEDVKWYREMYQEIKDLYLILDGLEYADYCIVVATPEDPTDTSDDAGDWWQNPWSLQKNVSVVLDYDLVTHPTEMLED